MFNSPSTRLVSFTALAVPMLGFAAVGSVLTVNASHATGQAAPVTCTNNPTTDTNAIRAALTYAASGSTVWIHAGTCALNGNLPVRTSVVITGAGEAATVLMQHSTSNIFQITVPGVTVENMTLDTATYNPGPAILKSPKPAVLFSASSNTHVFNVTAHAGSGFGMRITGPSPCDTYQTTGTVVQNLTLTNSGHGGFAGLDIDCTSGASLSAITIRGNYIALFQDRNVTLDHESYTPDAKLCQAPWYITGSASNLTITNVRGGGRGIAKGAVTGLVIANQQFVAGC